MAVVALRGGRQRKEDSVDPAVGLLWRAPLGAALATEYEGTFSGGVYLDWLVMAAMTILCLAATCAILARRRPRVARS